MNTNHEKSPCINAANYDKKTKQKMASILKGKLKNTNPGVDVKKVVTNVVLQEKDITN